MKAAAILCLSLFVLFLFCFRMVRDQEKPRVSESSTGGSLGFFDLQGKVLPLERLGGEGMRYRLERPLKIEGSRLALYLQLAGAGGSRLEATGPGGETLARRELPHNGGSPLTFLLPLPRGGSLAGFALEKAAGNGRRPEVLRAGLGPGFSGFELRPGSRVIGSGISSIEWHEGRQDVGLSADLFHPSPQALWGLELELTVSPVSWAEFRREDRPLFPRRRWELTLSLEEGSRSAGFRVKAAAGATRLLLYPGNVPFSPRAIGLSWDPRQGNGQITRLEVSLHPHQGVRGELVPLPAGPATVLSYRREAWRRPEFELFSWSLCPSILIFDTSSYRLQDRMFKRLAFFVEKKGFRGRLAADEEFAGLHGWNAHDYRAEDLAGFFRRAREEGFPLNEEEGLLEKILLASGVLRREQAGGILPGEGGLLSISRSSLPALRSHLLTHECLHGLFFSLPAYREACFRLWESLEEPERRFWELFLDWSGYDTTERTLVVNEFQAYLLQQERERVEPYFKEVMVSRMLHSRPELKREIGAFLDGRPDSFSRSFDALQAALWETARLEGGRLIEFY